MTSDNFHFEFLQDELVVLDGSAGVVHRISGETAAAVRNETDPVTRRTLIRSALALGAAVGVTTLVLPSAAAASSGGGDPGWTGGSGDAEGPAAVTGLAADPWANSVTLSWNTEWGMTYKVYQRVAGVGSYVLAGETSESPLTISSLDNLTTYQFIVVAVDQFGLASAPTSPLSVTPLTLGNGWEPPANVGATAGTAMNGAPLISVGWKRPLTLESPNGYEVEYRKTTTISWSYYSVVGDLGVAIDNQFRPGGTEVIAGGSSYYVRVRARYWDSVNSQVEYSTWVEVGPVAL